MKLFSPLVFRNGITCKNRLAVAPMTNQQSHADGTLSDAEYAWLVQRAEGGFGVVITCAAHVALDGQGWPGELGIFDDAQLPGLHRLATGIKTHGAIALAQIFHGGARAPRDLTGSVPWSASAMPDDPALPRAATEADIERVISQFRDAAIRAHTAGFDGVELHGAHGYLLGQFLSATQNQRSDDWGGSLEARARLLRTVFREVRNAVPKSFVVTVRISPEDYGNAKGLDLDENLTLAKWLVQDGIDALHVSLWDAFLPSHKRPAERTISLFRAALPSDVPLMIAGKVWTPKEAEDCLLAGADAVALGRAAIANPSWPNDARTASYAPKTPPLTRAELRDRGLSDPFIDYMSRWKGFVAQVE
jgi:2,4-dienoyl-CoA reductase-like NADH-dependent reductase (Old Yellow Enzyme family)